MILFYSDLDNTLIYSYKHDIGPNKKCVEIYQDIRIQSKILFIPTTTRRTLSSHLLSLEIPVTPLRLN